MVSAWFALGPYEGRVVSRGTSRRLDCRQFKFFLFLFSFRRFAWSWGARGEWVGGTVGPHEGLVVGRSTSRRLECQQIQISFTYHLSFVICHL